MSNNDKKVEAIDERLIELADALRTIAAFGDKLNDRDIGACADAAAVLDGKARPTHSDKLHLAKMLRERAEEVGRGIASPGTSHVMRQAADALEAPRGEYKLVRADVLAWLHGETAHPETGEWFERPEGEGAYWWRSRLRKATFDQSATTAQHDAEKRIAVIEECRAAVFHRFRKATQHSLVKSVLEVLDSLKKAQH